MMVRDATISHCGTYRYTLSRQWGNRSPTTCLLRKAGFIMLNPSTADAEIDDPTIRRCIGFAKAWGKDGVDIVNVYALRSTDPKALWQHNDPVGPENDRYIQDWVHYCSPIVAAWGAHAKPERVQRVLEIVRAHSVPLYCLGTTKAGAPRHPLYVKGDTQLRLYTGEDRK